jgi:DNA-directed RNA polymerase subunit M/transcription elongation factor TFIIS
VVATPIQQIRAGIQAGDWVLVCRGFDGMTGERLAPPTNVSVVVSLPDGFLDGLKAQVEEYVNRATKEKTEFILGQQRVSPELANDNFAAADEQEKDIVAIPQSLDDGPVKEDEPEPPAEPEDEFAKFRVQHGRPKRGDGDKQACRNVPFTPGMTNTFKDDGTLETGDIAESRRLSLAKQPEKRRPESKSVEVVCGKCGRKEQVPPLLAPKSLEKGHASSYVCNRCTRKA